MLTDAFPSLADTAAGRGWVLGLTV